MSKITDTTSTGVADLDLITSMVKEINNINIFLNDLGYDTKEGMLSHLDDFQANGRVRPMQTYGAQEFRVYSGRFSSPLKKSGVHPNVKLTLPGLSKGLAFENLVVTPVTTNAIAAKCDISLQIISYSRTEVVVKVRTATPPTQDTNFVVNCIGVALEKGATANTV